VQGINRERVTEWLIEYVDGARAPFEFALIAGGHSNLTFAVTGADGERFVLRRPPLGHVLASAHDMGREHRIIAALRDTAVPVAPALGFCADEEVNGAPFYVMGYVDAIVVRDQPAANRLSLDARRHASESIADTLAAIHAVDLDAVGLGDLGRKEGYIERQLKRWYGQWNQSKTRELAVVDEVYEHLRTHIPEQGKATIVHGDYRLDNTMVDTDGRVVAVLDWEICTLGDPMADVGLLQVYWTGPHDVVAGIAAPQTANEGFLDRADVLARYARVSGRDVSGVDYFTAFAYWKLACIVEGVYARYLHGAMGTGVEPATYDPFRLQVERTAQSAAERCAAIG
jgi:aminoglycoside phosphotransferase (APT) family kinase protein